MKVLKEVWQIAQAIMALRVVYNLVAHTVNEVYRISSDQRAGAQEILPPFLAASAGPEDVKCPKIAEFFGEPGERVCVCVVSAVAAGGFLAVVCEAEWVQEEEDCDWDDCSWTDPGACAEAAYCSAKEGLKWVLRQICKLKWVVVFIYVTICIIVSVGGEAPQPPEDAVTSTPP